MTRVGLLLAGFDRTVAIAAEQHGFDSLWLGDGPLHACTLLGALAAVTSTARLGAIVDTTGRNPAVVAKHVTTLDRVSRGRAALAIRAADAGAAEEAVRAARATFVDDAINQPAPLQPGGPPIAVIGAPAVTARHADAAVLVGDAAELAPQLDLLARHCSESARDPATLRTMWLPSGAATPERIAEAAAAAGIDDVVLDLGRASVQAVADAGRAVRSVTGAAR